MASSTIAESYDPLGAHLDDPHPFYARARRTEPVFRSARLDAWVITRFDDVDTALKDGEVFSSVNSVRPVRDLFPGTFAAFAGAFPSKPNHVNTDGQAHRRLRAPYARRLTPAAVRAQEPAVRKRADALVESFVADSRAELVEQFISPLVMGAAADLFGIAAEDVAAVRSGSESMFRLGSPELDEAQELRAAYEFVAFQHLIAGYVRQRRAAPQDDLISDVVAALAPGPEPLSDEQEAELVTTICGSIGAGQLTPTDAIANAVRMLLGHPDQWELLCRRPELMAGAVEEVVRFEPPVPAMFRRATRAVTLGGAAIPEGADVLLVFASANRDETQFPDPDRLDVTRTPSRHFGFGAGVHTCIGAPLARAQVRTALQVLTERLPKLRLAPEHPVRVPASINSRGPVALEVCW